MVIISLYAKKAELLKVQKKKKRSRATSFRLRAAPGLARYENQMLYFQFL